MRLKSGLGFLTACLMCCGLASAAPAPNSVQLLQPLDGTGTGDKETNLGDLVADSVAATGGTQIALVPADEITETVVPAGTVDPDTIVHTLSYYGDTTDTVIVLDLTGDQIDQALTRSASREPHDYEGFLQVSGLRVTIDRGAVSVTDTLGTRIDAAAHYKVSVNASLAAGELGYFNVWGKSAKGQDTGVPIALSLTNYLAAHRVLSGTTDNRITVN